MKNYKVLFVCLGNICRSPAGEGIFKKMVKERGMEKYITVDSAGTSGYHNGDLPDSRMRQHGARRDINSIHCPVNLPLKILITST